MNKRLLAWIISFCALGLASTAGYYSIIGLSKLFAGVEMAVIIMAVFLEISKITIAILLHSYWVKLNIIARGYFIISLVILSLITSAGIYGLLSSGYEETSSKLVVSNSKIELLENRKFNYDNQIVLYTEENIITSNSIIGLRNGLSNNKIQYIDKETGQLVNTTSSNTRRSLEKQLDYALVRQGKINNKIDSVSNLKFDIEEQILSLKNTQQTTNELGTWEFISKAFNEPMDKIVNRLLMVLVFVFDPLAIALVIAANFAFSQLTNNKKKIMNFKKNKNKELTSIIPNEDSPTLEVKDKDGEALLTVSSDNEVIIQPKEEIKVEGFDPLAEQKVMLANPNLSTFRRKKIIAQYPELG